MKKVRPVVARNAREHAKELGLAPAEGMEIEFRSDLNDKIVEVVGKKGLTHSDTQSWTPPSSDFETKASQQESKISHQRTVVTNAEPRAVATGPGQGGPDKEVNDRNPN